MKAINEIKVQFPSKSVNEGFARAVVSSFAAQLDPTIDELADIKTAVSEGVTNAIVHGYRRESGIITITARLYEDRRIQLTIRDRGCGIADVHKAMEPCYTTAPEEERSGMGFTIMQTFMDKLRVTSKPGWGTRVVMEKYIGKREN
ncbi:anti-sigma F factor [Feifania hominis]|uniref:Anti-sigma F factor n=1 Tax=Feifania hominis TaxID=2763660 RepID=A0A926DAJ7_9FIRM|nr:anti-sigma F factor [Feifania hominis]MBC8535450.1 anti-sigma F factor [Feifania hominis]